MENIFFDTFIDKESVKIDENGDLYINFEEDSYYLGHIPNVDAFKEDESFLITISNISLKKIIKKYFEEQIHKLLNNLYNELSRY